MDKSDSAYYRGLVEFARQHDEILQRINNQAIQLMQRDEVVRAMRAAYDTANAAAPHMRAAVLGMAYAIEGAMPAIDAATMKIYQSMEAVAAQYNQLFRAYDFHAIADNVRLALEQSQIITIAQLCLSYETEMIHDAIGCFANAKYEYLPSVFNQAMARPVMGAADVAFLKTGSIIPIIESELVYPRGLKTTLGVLNRSTARDIADNGDIEYDTGKNQFIGADSGLSARGMNVVCAGIEVFRSESGLAGSGSGSTPSDGDDLDSGDLFTETELMDFISLLSRTPMVAVMHETGKKIYRWIEQMRLKQQNAMDFDRELYYHSRSRSKEAMPFTFEEMMKAPYGLPGAGRYNPVGRAHFYFASTQKGAEVEVKKHLKSGEIVQTVKLKPVKKICLLDLSGTLRRGASFLKMIRYPLANDENKMPKEYLLPCFVADCCQLLGFDGIKYYGSKEYDNYVSWSDAYFKDAGMCAQPEEMR